MNKFDYICLGLVGVGALASVLLYGQLPDPMPTHWNAEGVADGFTPLPWGAFLMPLTGLGMHALLRLLPVISPKGFRMDRFMDAYLKVMTAAIAFLMLVHGAVLWLSLGRSLDLTMWIVVGLGVLFAVIGNYMNKTQPNFFFGIRTPWTLADPEVWARTHRVTGWAFMVVGLLTVIAGLALAQPYAIGISVTAIVAVAVGAIVYSFVLYRKLNA